MIIPSGRGNCKKTERNTNEKIPENRDLKGKKDDQRDLISFRQRLQIILSL